MTTCKLHQWNEPCPTCAFDTRVRGRDVGTLGAIAWRNLGGLIAGKMRDAEIHERDRVRMLKHG